MADETAEPEEPKKSPVRRALLIGLPLALLAGGGAFYAAYSGMLSSDAADEKQETSDTSKDDPVAFVALDPMIVSIGRADRGRHLRFHAQLEVKPKDADAVQAVLPRIVDVLNGYLRAVDIAVLDDPTALIRIRSQMLRRVQIVAGEDRVKDLLIMEFVLS